MCALVCLLRNLMLFPLELKLCRTLWSVDVVLEGVYAGLLGEGLAVPILRGLVSVEMRP